MGNGAENDDKNVKEREDEREKDQDPHKSREGNRMEGEKSKRQLVQQKAND